MFKTQVQLASLIQTSDFKMMDPRNLNMIPQNVNKKYQHET